MVKTALKINLRVLVQELFWYALAVAAAALSGRRLIQTVEKLAVAPEDQGFSLGAFFLWFGLATVVFLLLLNVVRSRWFFETLFALSLFSGIWFLLDTFLPGGWALPLALLAVLGREFIKRVAVHNLVVVLGIAGVATSLGLALTPMASAIILAVLAVYDVIAVYGTKHMVKMFTSLLREHVVLAVVLPERFKDNFVSLKTVRPGSGFFLLGTGDLALPLLFFASTLPLGNSVAAATAGGIFFGLGLTHLLFMSQRGRRPMPALPPLVLGTLLGFLVGLLLNRTP